MAATGSSREASTQMGGAERAGVLELGGHLTSTAMIGMRRHQGAALDAR